MKRRLAVPIAFSMAGIALLALAVGSFARPAPTVTTYQVGSSPSGPADGDTPRAGLAATISAARTRLHDDPADMDAWARLGSAYTEQALITGDPSYYPKADSAFQHSLALDRAGNWPAMAGLAGLANARNDFRTALTRARQAQTVNPDDAGVYGVLEEAQTQLGDYPAAAVTAAKILELGSGTAELSMAAEQYEERGQTGPARTARLRALAAARSPAEIAAARHGLGELAFDTGDPKAALRQYRLGLVADPVSDPLLAGQARAEAALGRTDDALRDYGIVTGGTTQPQYLLEYAELLQSLDRDDESDQQLARLAAAQKLLTANGVVVDLLAAVVEADHGSATSAVRHAEAEWDRRQSVVVADALGWALHRAGRDREAVTYATRANRLGRANATRLYHLGLIQLSLGRRAEAHRNLATALKVNPYFSVLQAPLARQALKLSTAAK